MSVRRPDPSGRVTPELLAFHKADAKQLRAEACDAIRGRIWAWLKRWLRW